MPSPVKNALNFAPNSYRSYVFEQLCITHEFVIFLFSWKLAVSCSRIQQITAFLHTFVAQHKGSGTGEGMLCDLIPKSPQSGWDVGLIEVLEVLEGKKAESHHSAKKSIYIYIYLYIINPVYKP